jgi:hypothetical protein
MRLPREFKPQFPACYLCSCKVVFSRGIFDNPTTKLFHDWMERCAAFCGVSVPEATLDRKGYSLLAVVHDPATLSDAHLLRAYGHLYGPVLKARLCRRLLAGGEEEQQALRHLRYGAGRIDVFQQLVKQGFTTRYNYAHRRKGTLWQGRYDSILLPEDDAAIRVAAVTLTIMAEDAATGAEMLAELAAAAIAAKKAHKAKTGEEELDVDEMVEMVAAANNTAAGMASDEGAEPGQAAGDESPADTDAAAAEQSYSDESQADTEDEDAAEQDASDDAQADTDDGEQADVEADDAEKADVAEADVEAAGAGQSGRKPKWKPVSYKPTKRHVDGLPPSKQPDKHLAIWSNWGRAQAGNKWALKEMARYFPPTAEYTTLQRYEATKQYVRWLVENPEGDPQLALPPEWLMVATGLVMDFFAGVRDIRYYSALTRSGYGRVLHVPSVLQELVTKRGLRIARAKKAHSLEITTKHGERLQMLLRPKKH